MTVPKTISDTPVVLHVAETLRAGRVVVIEREDHRLSLWFVYSDGSSERLDADLADDGLAPACRLYLRGDGLWPSLTRELERHEVLVRTTYVVTVPDGDGVSERRYDECVPI